MGVSGRKGPATALSEPVRVTTAGGGGKQGNRVEKGVVALPG